MEDCWANEKMTRPAIEDVVKRMMILQGSASTYRGVKNERALSNGSDVALRVRLRPRYDHLHPSEKQKPTLGWTINARVSSLFTLPNLNLFPPGYIPAASCLDSLFVFPRFYVVIYNEP
jgi:hypothetical protein